MVQFMLFVVIVEHFILILKTFIEQSINDTPSFVIHGERQRDDVKALQRNGHFKSGDNQFDESKDMVKKINDAKLLLAGEHMISVEQNLFQTGLTKKL